MKANRDALIPALFALAVTATACGAGTDHDNAPDDARPAPVGQSAPPTSTGPIGAANVPLDTGIDVPDSRAALEAGHAEIGRILEDTLGADGWREAREAQEVACPSRADASGGLDDGIGKFYAAELRHPDVLAPDEWAAVREEIIPAVEAQGFRLKEEGAGEDAQAEGADYTYFINEFSDELTLSTHPVNGTGYGGFGACHPWGAG